MISKQEPAKKLKKTNISPSKILIFSFLAGSCLEIKFFSYFLCFLTSYNISQPKKWGPFESETKVVYCPPLILTEEIETLKAKPATPTPSNDAERVINVEKEVLAIQQ